MEIIEADDSEEQIRYHWYFAYSFVQSIQFSPHQFFPNWIGLQVFHSTLDLSSTATVSKRLGRHFFFFFQDWLHSSRILTLHAPL